MNRSMTCPRISPRDSFATGLTGLILAIAVSFNTVLATPSPNGMDTESYVDSGPGFSVATSDTCCTSCWNASVDALFLRRSTAASFGLLFEEEGDEEVGAELLNANNLGFDFEVGARVRLERAVGCGNVLELSYFGIYDWHSSAQFGPGNYLVLGDASRSGPFVNTATFDYDSTIHTIELNLRGWQGNWFQPLVGFRWLRLAEDYRVSGVGDFDGTIPYVLHYDTDSDLYGGQIGGLARLWDRGGRFTVSGIGKAGLYLCDATNHGRFDADVFQFDGNGATSQTAFVGEIGVEAAYRLTCHWSVNAGYQALWLDGVALAPNQIAVTDVAEQTGGITTDGYLLLHGAHFGLEAKW